MLSNQLTGLNITRDKADIRAQDIRREKTRGVMWCPVTTVDILVACVAGNLDTL